MPVGRSGHRGSGLATGLVRPDQTLRVLVKVRRRRLAERGTDHAGLATAAGTHVGDVHR